MAEFNNVTVIKEANVYFDGKVSSRAIVFADGSKKTLGVMLPGEYQFNTGERERMEILSGDLEVAIAGGAWLTVSGGQEFEVPANSSFNLKVKTVTDYCCSFLKD